MKLTIGKRITAGFAGVVLITAILGGFAYTRLEVLGERVTVLATDALPGVIQAGDIDSGVRENYAWVLHHVLASDAQERAAIEQRIQATAEANNKVCKEYESTMVAEEDRRLFAAMGEAQQAYRQRRDTVLTLSREDKDKEAVAAIKTQLDPAYEKYVAAAQALADYNRQNGETAGKTAVAAASSGQHGALVGVGVAVVISGILGFFIIRGTNKVLNRLAETLGDGSAQVATASSQVSSSSQSLAQGASEQAAALEETTSALEEMSSMTKKNAETAQQASALSAEAQKAATKGNEAMTRMGAAITEIQKSAGETAKIIKVIDEIAFQTNLLALNAAVEAARAGEAGKGFAVVAEEVRNLAMRSAEAAKNTASMIEESVNNAKNGVAISTEVAKTLEEINASVSKVNGLVGEIAAASQEQSQGIGQVNTAVGQMDKVTQATAANAEESASASEELNSQAEQMRGVVQELIALVNGASAAHAGHSEGVAHRPLVHAAKVTAAPAAASKEAKASTVIPLNEQEKAKSGQFADFSATA